MGFQSLSKLVGTRRAATATINAFETGNGIGNLHTLDEGSDALGVAVASADKFNRSDGIALHIEFNGTGTSASGLINFHTKNLLCSSALRLNTPHNHCTNNTTVDRSGNPCNGIREGDCSE